MIELDNFSAGTYRNGIDYRYFMPEFINTEWVWNDPSINTLLEQASFELGQLNSYARLVPNIDLFIHLHITKEAVVSSRIEGTQTEFDEALLQKENVANERKEDWQEIKNYTDAMNNALAELSTLPISSRLLVHTHSILLQGVRGEKKNPGEYRRSQNWIGGKSIADAVFIPPHHEHLHALMSDLENFIHNKHLNIPLLIKAAILHYQFETIHPFLDGNGRIGRLLITLFFIEKKILYKPLLYLSQYFESDKSLYYDNLMRVRTHHDMKQWIKYFLVGIVETSQKAVHTLSNILAMKDSHEKMIKEKFGKRIKTGLLLHQHILHKPVITLKEAQNLLELSPKATGDLIKLCEQYGLLREATGRFRNRVFLYFDYLNLF